MEGIGPEPMCQETALSGCATDSKCNGPETASGDMESNAGEDKWTRAQRNDMEQRSQERPAIDMESLSYALEWTRIEMEETCSEREKHGTGWRWIGLEVTGCAGEQKGT